LVRALNAQVDARPAGHEAVTELYLFGPDIPEAQQDASDLLRRLVASLPVSQRVRRISLAVAPVRAGRSGTSPTARPAAP